MIWVGLGWVGLDTIRAGLEGDGMSGREEEGEEDGWIRRRMDEWMDGWIRSGVVVGLVHF